jgi:hypothetical protein
MDQHEYRTSVTPLRGINDGSARPSQLGESGRPLSIRVTCRLSEPRTDSSASPREFVRTNTCGTVRRSAASVGAAPINAESGRTTARAEPPMAVETRAPRTSCGSIRCAVESVGAGVGCCATAFAGSAATTIAAEMTAQYDRRVTAYFA